MATTWAGSGALARNKRSTSLVRGYARAATRLLFSTFSRSCKSPFRGSTTPFSMGLSATKPSAIRNNGQRRNSQLAATVSKGIPAAQESTNQQESSNASSENPMNKHPLLQTRLHTLRNFAACSIAAVLLLALAPALTAQAPVTSVETLRKNFVNPPNEARPMVRWWWFGAAVVKPEILRELQQMKADGIQGAELAFEYPEVLDDPAKGLKNLPFLSPEMLDDVNFAQSEGRKLGLRIDVTLCSGWPYGGPHITLDEAVSALHTFEVPVPAQCTPPPGAPAPAPPPPRGGRPRPPPPRSPPPAPTPPRAAPPGGPPPEGIRGGGGMGRNGDFE